MPMWMMGGLLAFFVFAVGLAAVLVFMAVRSAVVAIQMPGSGQFPVVVDGTAASGSGGGTDGDAGSGGGAPIGNPINIRPWAGTNRVTVLVMGIDERSCEVERAYRTDSMMLLTMDPVGNTAAILSVPRDLYVTIPGFDGRDKINTANYKGDAFQLPGGGPQLAMDTIELNLGIQVDYYARVNFTAFETLVDEIGGIEVEVLQTIDDPTYPDNCFGYDPFYLPAGTQVLNGYNALRYARTRSTFGGDFDRAYRQQQVVMALRDKVLRLDMVPTLLVRAPNLYNTLAGSYDTNMTFDQMIALGLKAMEIPESSITTAVIDQTYIQESYMTESSGQVEILNVERFRELRDALFYTPTQPNAPLPELDSLMAAEGARVEVQNGSTTEGLAGIVADYLQGQGVNVVAVNNATRTDYATSVIIDQGSRPYTTRWLAQEFRIPASSIFTESASGGTADVILIIGANFVLPNP